MSILRTVGKALGGVIFSTCLAFMVISIGMASFTEYGSMKSMFSSIIGDFITADQQSLDMMLAAMKQQCVGKESIEFNPNQGDPSSVLIINCSYANRQDANVNDILATAIFDKAYYKSYSCSFIDCIMAGDMSVMTSAKGHASFESLQFVMLSAAVAGAAMIVISEESWPGRLKGLGMPMVFVGVPYFLIDLIMPAIFSNIFSGESASLLGKVSSSISSVMSAMKTYFLCVFIAGLALAATGYALGYVQKRNVAKKTSVNSTKKP